MNPPPPERDMRQRDWAHANPYLHRYLPAHAAAAGLLDEVLDDTRYLLYTDPRRLARALTTDPTQHRNTHLIWRSLGDLTTTTDPAERANILNTIAARDEPDAAAALNTYPERGLRTLWTTAQRTSFHRLLPGHTAAVDVVAFGTRSDGTLLLASGGADHTVRIWDVEAGQPTGPPLTGHTGGVWSVAIGARPDGSLILASGSADRTIRLWDVATGEPAGPPLTGHTGSVSSVAIGARPDGSLILASGSADRTIRLWDVATGEP
ncbi:WD40 repeat domain-containing protein, partial [Nocardia salmonicida]|uniref:WD40 repeat domain-containing protein n=1 Tax=Nocardia salmonicida TaxID=53431 RepID=UPI003CE9BD34